MKIVALVALFTFMAGAWAAKPNWFGSAADCISAVKEGEYEFYTPKFFGGKDRNPPDGIKKIVVPLEAVACVKMKTAIGRGEDAYKWVVQPTGTKMRWLVKDGRPDTVYARDDCGNTVREIIFVEMGKPTPRPTHHPQVPPVQPAQTAAPAPQPQYIPVYPAVYAASAPQQVVVERPWYEPFLGLFRGATIVYSPNNSRGGSYNSSSSSNWSWNWGTTSSTGTPPVIQTCPPGQAGPSCGLGTGGTGMPPVIRTCPPGQAGPNC